MRSRFPLGRKHQRTASHIPSCDECASALRRERQYLERLRDAPIPPASDDLTARLLARTRELAAQPAAAPPRHPAPLAVVRVLALTAGATVAAAGVLAAGAFAMAGDPAPAGGATAAALSQVSAQTPADGRALSAERLSGLRTEGWVCPELEAMGFHLESAKAMVLDGGPAVELKLFDGTHYATVTERHNPEAGPAADPGVGHAGPALQILGSSPWSATLQAHGRSFTYVSDLPAEQADDAMPILQRLSEQAGEGVAARVLEPAGARNPESVGARLQRGINMIVALFTQ